MNKVNSMLQPAQNRNWNKRYQTGDTPWTAHDLIVPLLQAIQQLYPHSTQTSVLEVGCGHAKESIALRKLGYELTAIDLSEAAIAQAKINAEQEKMSINFFAGDILHDALPFNLFDLVFDVAVLQTIDDNTIQKQFAEKMANLLKTNGYWVNFACISPDVLEVEKITGVKAPPALSKEVLNEITKKHFVLESRHAASYHICREGKRANFPAFVSVFKKV